MSRMQIGPLVAVITIGSLVCVTAPVVAQSSSDADDARIQLGAVALSPSFRLMNIGFDNNIFRDAERSTGDITATVSPAVDAWVRLPRARVTAHTEWDYVYFNELSRLRSLDTVNSARVEVPLNRFTPYVAATLSNTRHRQTFEIDARARRKADGVLVGADLRLTSKTTVGVRTTRSNVEYEANALYLGSDLARLLNATGRGEGLSFRYALTPLTTVVLDAQRYRDRFEFSPDRDSDSFEVMPGVELKPLALVSGRAAVGFRKRSFLNQESAEFRGTVARVDLRYTLQGRTRFGIELQRDLEYSYRVERSQYILAALTASVAHRLSTAWDVEGRAGRSRLTYRQAALGNDEAETVFNYAVDVGYRLRATRLGVHFRRGERQSEVSPSREYQRFQFGSSLTYDF